MAVIKSYNGLVKIWLRFSGRTNLMSKLSSIFLQSPSLFIKIEVIFYFKEVSNEWILLILTQND